MRQFSFLFSFFLSLFSVSCIGAKDIDYVYLEAYGAKGDGINDDAVALGKCIKEGRSVRLKPGKVYLLKSKLPHIVSDTFCLKGGGARLVLDKDFPVERNCAVFYLSHLSSPKYFRIDSLNIECYLGKKDSLKNGDTYFILAKKCDKVEFENMSFETYGKYNNVTFLRSEGGDVDMDKCNIVMNTLSERGGIFWLLNRYRENCHINIKNSYFEHDAKDECMCFAMSKDANILNPKITVCVDNCKYRTKAESESSGFIIVYSKNSDLYSEIEVKYKNCEFESDGKYHRYIESYQCGTDSLHNYGSFRTEFENCNFNFSMIKDNNHDERGLLSLIYRKSNGIKSENVGFVFKNCNFNVKGVHPVIGDKDADRKGYYKFYDCNIEIDDRAFQKKYNITSSDLSLHMDKCKVKSKDLFFNQGHVVIKRCDFMSPKGERKKVTVKSIK